MFVDTNGIQLIHGLPPAQCIASFSCVEIYNSGCETKSEDLYGYEIQPGARPGKEATCHGVLFIQQYSNN